MTPAEEDLLADVRLDHAWSLLEEFATYKREHPDDVNRAMRSVKHRLEELGVPVLLHAARLYLSLPGPGEVVAGGRHFRAKPPAYSIHAPEGIEGKLVYVPAGHPGDITAMFNKDVDARQRSRVAGNIVISEGFAGPGMVEKFAELGAVGVIGVNPGVDIHWGICTTIWGTPDLDDLPRKPKIAAAAVNKPDGEALIEIARAGGAVRLVTNLREGWYDQHVAEVRIDGCEQPEKFLLLHGHLDSWDVGIGDNATGDATLLEAARLLWRHRDKLRRSVRIVWWPGHSTGRYAGSAWYADHFAIDLDENCIAQVNCDSPGCRWAVTYDNLSAMSESEDFIAQVIREVAGVEAHCERPHRAGDYSFNNIGIPSYLMLSSTMTDERRKELGYYAVGGNGGNIAWHTEHDTLEIADRTVLETDVKVYTLAAFRHANAEILPSDWRKTAAEFRATISGYQQKAGNRFDFSLVTQAVDSLAQALDSFYADIEVGRISKERANRIIMDLARWLVPINYTREPRFRHDPALSIGPLPTLSAAAELDAHEAAGTLGFAQNHLVRGQNRVIATLRAAERLVNDR